jgi:hypothetical protein
MWRAALHEAAAKSSVGGYCKTATGNREWGGDSGALLYYLDQLAGARLLVRVKVVVEP